MKAVIFQKHGGPEVLEYADVPDPSPKEGEVLLKVKACSVNHLDIWIRQGIPAYKIQLPHISGCDVSGVVEQTASGVSTLKPGMRVLLTPNVSCGLCEDCATGLEQFCKNYGIRGAATDGGYAEWITAKAGDVLPLADTVTFEQAAAFPLVFLTAWHMLVTRAKLQPGESVLIHAAGSGIGHAAIQIAKYLKATVYATVGSDAKISKAKMLGADFVFNYKDGSFESQIKEATGARGVNVVFEHIGPQTWEASLRLLARAGRLVTCGATTGPSVPLDLRYVYSRQLSILGSMMGTNRELRMVSQLVGQGALRPIVDTVFPLPEARAAQERMLSRDFFGKLLLIPD